MNGEFGLLFLILFPIAAGLLAYPISEKSPRWGAVLTVAVPAAEGAALAAVCLFGGASFGWDGFCGLGIGLCLDGFRVIYCAIIVLLWLMTGLFSGDYFKKPRLMGRYRLFNLLALGATMGVFLAQDMFTAFIFFEVMSLASYEWVAHDETPGAIRAGNTYLAVAVIGGLVTLMGLLLIYKELGTLRLDGLSAAEGDRATLYTAGCCVLFGFGAKAGMFPLHIWMSDSYNAAPAPETALLSGILSKVGIFGILALSCNMFPNDPQWGAMMLVLGLMTMLVGGSMALLSADLKRTLALSSMSQIGFILFGVGAMCLTGDESPLAARGVMLHMVNHSMVKLTLFMAAGVVAANLGVTALSDVRGFGRRKPFLNFTFLMGALGVGGVPLWNGYVSKTLLHEAILEWGGPLSSVAEWLFLISGGLTIAYMAKLYIALFVEKHPTRQREFDGMKKYMGLGSRLALGLSALALPVMGLFPGGIMDPLADKSGAFFGASGASVSYFSLENLKGAAISLCLGAALYLLVVRTLVRKSGEYRERWPGWMSLENKVYRPLLMNILPRVFGAVCRVFGENLVLRQGWKAALWTGNLAAKGASDVPDALVLALGRTVLKPRSDHPETMTSQPLSYRAGLLLDEAGAAVRHREPDSRHARRFLRTSHTLSHTTGRIAGSLSFALLMACLGLGFVLIYLLIIAG